MKDIHRVYITHTINNIATSIISIYIPAYLLTLGFPLPRVILFYAIYHLTGLAFNLFLFPLLVNKWGILNTFKIYFPMQIIYIFLLSIIKTNPINIEIIAVIGGVANYAYWIPMNIFLIKFSEQKEMAISFSRFTALPNLFGIIGPLIAAIFIPFIGFWPVFVLTVAGLIASCLPLAHIDEKEIIVSLNISKAWKRLSRNKTLFVFELLDNIIEESEWFWSIYVFLLIGSLRAPGIVGSLEAIGGALFTLFIGKYVNRHGKRLIPLTAVFLFVITLVKIFINQPLNAYLATVVASFLLTFFLVVYFSTVYKTIKNDDEEEFMIVREIPVVLGRMVVFGMIFLTIHNLRFFFVLPLAMVLAMMALYLRKGKILAS